MPTKKADWLPRKANWQVLASLERSKRNSNVGLQDEVPFLVLLDVRSPRSKLHQVVCEPTCKQHKSKHRGSWRCRTRSLHSDFVIIMHWILAGKVRLSM